MSKLTAEQKKQIDTVYEPGVYGYRKTAEHLGLPPGQVRYYIENEYGGYIPSNTNPDLDLFSFSASVRPYFSPFKAVVWDIETNHLRTDIGTLLVVSFLDLSNSQLNTRTIYDVDKSEEALAVWAAEQYKRADIIIGHNSVAFDKNFVNGVLARYGRDPLPKKIQADTYLIARYGFKGLLQSYSLENVADFFRLGKKDRPSKHDWRESVVLDEDAIDRIADRCEADVRLNAQVFEKLKPYWNIWKGQ